MSGPDRITFVVERLHPMLGTERVAARVAELVGAGRPTRVVAAYGPPVPVPGVQVVSLGATPRRLKWPVHTWRLLLFARRHRRERVVLVGPWVAVPWLLLGGGAGRSVVWEHSLMRERIARARGRRVLYRLARVLYRRVPAVIAVSEPLADDLRGWLPGDRVRVIPNPAEPVVGTAAAPPGTGPWRRVAVVGKLSTVKGQALAVHAAAAVPGLHVDVYGDGPTRGELERLVSSLGLGSRVTLHGHQDHAIVLRGIRAADGLVHCAESETFGMVYLEAAALGRPVLAARNRAAEWLVPAYVPGRLFDDLDGLVAELRAGHRPSIAELRDAHERRERELGDAPVRAAWEDAVDRLLAGGRS